MLLREFIDNDPLRVKLIAVVSHIKARIEDTGADDTMRVESFLQLLRKHGVAIDKTDLRDLVEKPPLSNIVGSIDDNNIRFSENGEDTFDDLTDNMMGINDDDEQNLEEPGEDTLDDPLSQDLDIDQSQYDPSQTVGDFNTKTVDQMAKRAVNKRI